MKTRRDGVSVVQVNNAFDNALRDPDALLERYATLTGWAEAVRDADADRSAVVQQFSRAAAAHVDRCRRAGRGDQRVARRTGDPLGWPPRANKEPLTVVDAFEQALPSLPNATLTMLYGTADLAHDVRAQIDRHPALRGRVRLIGAVPHRDIAAYYSAADLFVVGSHHEGSGYALIEALACGVTPAVTDIPDLPVAGGRWRHWPFCRRVQFCGDRTTHAGDLPLRHCRPPLIKIER